MDISRAGPAQKRVKLSLSPDASKQGQAELEAEEFRPLSTWTPDLFDAEPSEATGVAPNRRKSSRSRVYSQSSSGLKGVCL